MGWAFCMEQARCDTVCALITQHLFEGVQYAQTRVRTPHPKICKLACKAQGVGVFAKGEIPVAFDCKAPLQSGRRGRRPLRFCSSSIVYSKKAPVRVPFCYQQMLYSHVEKSKIALPFSSFKYASYCFPLFLETNPRILAVLPVSKSDLIFDTDMARPPMNSPTLNSHPSR